MRRTSSGRSTGEAVEVRVHTLDLSTLTHRTILAHVKQEAPTQRLMFNKDAFSPLPLSPTNQPLHQGVC